MSKMDKYLNTNIKDVLDDIANYSERILFSDRETELSKTNLINILNSVSQGTPPDLAFRAEGLHHLFKQMVSLYKIFRGNLIVPECRIYALIERVWFRSLSQVTNNIYRHAIHEDAKTAIPAAKLLLDYHAKMEQKMEQYDEIRNLQGDLK